MVTTTLGEQAAARCSQCAATRDAGYVGARGWEIGPTGERHNHLSPDWWHGAANNARGGTRMAKTIGMTKFVPHVRDTTPTASEAQAARDLAKNFRSTPKAHVATFESVAASSGCPTCADTVAANEPGAIWMIGADGLPHKHPDPNTTFTYSPQSSARR